MTTDGIYFVLARDPHHSAFVPIAESKKNEIIASGKMDRR
jgi:hypothetical protein